jgi:hypothetical protein
MKISQNLLRWALAGLTAASSISSAQVQPPAQNMFNFSSKSLSDLRADVEKANALVNTKKSEVLSARNALLANAGFAQLNPLYKEALKLNITPEKFDINVIAQRRDIVKSVYDSIMEQGRRPCQQYFSTWWGDGRTGPSVQHIPNYIAFLAHARVRQAYLTGKSASDTAAVNAVFVDVSTWEDKLQNEALLQLPWPGRTVIQEGGKVRFTDGLALFGDGQYLWTAWGADPGKGTIERNCSSGDRTFSDALKDVRKICMVISGSEIRTRGTLCAKGATCSLADPRFSSLAGPRFIYAVYDGGYGLVGAGPSKCGTSGDCTVLPLEPFGYGYQAFVGAWTRVID